MKKSKTPFSLKVVQWVYPNVERILPNLAHRFFIKIFFTPLSYKVPLRERVLENEAEKFEVQIPGKRIQCYSWGKGPVLLLVHGWAGRATQFRKIIYAFVNAHYRVVGFDGPAHGNSAGRSTNIMEFEETFKKIYAVTGVPKGIITHSFGGGAVLFSAMNGMTVKKLINIATPTIGDEIISTYLKAIQGSQETARYFKAWIMKNNGKPFEEFTALHFIRNITQEIELLLIHDEQDQEVTIQHAHELIKNYPRASLYTTRGLGHTRILKDEGVIKKCITFMETVSIQPDIIHKGQR